MPRSRFRISLVAVALVIVVIGIGVFVYFYYQSNSSVITAEPGVTNPFEAVGDAEGNDGSEVIPDWSSGEGSSNGEVEYQSNEVTPRLTKIAPGPVAVGAVVLDQPDTATTTLGIPVATVNPLANIEVRYVMRASGNIFTYDADDGRSTRISNKTIPGVQDVSWLPDGTRAYLRLLVKDADRSEHIDTYAASVDGTEGSFLARDIASIDTAANRLFILMTSTGGTSASVSAADGSGGTTVFSSPIAGLRAEFAGSNYLAQTKPSRDIRGYAFLVNAGSGSFTRLLGPYAGLSSQTNPAGTQVLYSYVDDRAMRLALYTIADQSIIPLPIQTLVEKCVFAPDGRSAYCAVPMTLTTDSLPDSWYQGSTTFTDRIWKIDFVARITTVIADLPQLTEEPIDAVGLSTNPNGTALVFTNRRDGSLWLYSL